MPGNSWSQGVGMHNMLKYFQGIEILVYRSMYAISLMVWSMGSIDLKSIIRTHIKHKACISTETMHMAIL